MTSKHPQPDAQALAAEAEHLRAGFAELAAQIAAKVRHDRELARHLDQLGQQSARLAAPAADLPWRRGSRR